MQTFRLFHLHKDLFNFVCAVLCFHLHRLRLFHELRCQLGNAFRIGGREQKRLTILWALSGHGGNVVKETHVEHAVGFVQHQSFKALEFQRAAL